MKDLMLYLSKLCWYIPPVSIKHTQEESSVLVSGVYVYEPVAVSSLDSGHNLQINRNV